MANNSFLVKGWLITLIAVALALLPEKIEIKPVCIVGLIIITSFWYLDAFFLKTEKLYRWKYDWIIANRTIGNDSYYLNLDPYNEQMWTPEKNGEKRNPPCIGWKKRLRPPPIATEKKNHPLWRSLKNTKKLSPKHKSRSRPCSLIYMPDMTPLWKN